MKTMYAWSSVDRELSELSALAASSDLVEHHIGDDSSGNPTMVYTLGDLDTPTLLIVSGLHGNELAPREASLRTIREQTYRGAPERHSLAWMPTASPSACKAVNRRPPAHDTDPNGDPYRLQTVEALNLHRALNLVRPAAAIDMHETGRDELDVFYGDTSLDHIHPEVDRWSTRMRRDIGEALEADGWTYGLYPSASRITLRKVAEDKHCPMPLTETRIGGPRLDRISQNLTIQRYLIGWFAEHAREVKKSSDRSLHDALYGGDDEILMIDRWDTPNREDAWLTGWQLDDGSEFPPEFVEAFEIEVTTYGFVPLAQRSRKCLPFITDEGSVLEPVDTTRVTVTPSGGVAGMKIMHDGVAKAVTDIYVMVDGERRRVIDTRIGAEADG